ncbi:hypothetical protein ACJ41O_005498 [Fusarium nematophilum]
MPAKVPTFHPFPDLPPELRHQIWHAALPPKVGPTLYLFRPGCWHPRWLSETDQGYDPASRDNVNLEFRHDFLNHIQIESSLLLVNREARSIALAWLRQEGFGQQICWCEDRIGRAFARAFNPSQDALYIPIDKLDDFCLEPYDRLFQPDLHEISVSSGPDVKYIAVPEALLWGELNPLAGISEIFDWFLQLEVLFVVVDPQPDVEDGGVSLRGWWEIEQTQGRAFFWDAERGRFEMREGEYVGDLELYRLIDEAGKGLGEILARNQFTEFEIRPVVAMKR